MEQMKTQMRNRNKNAPLKMILSHFAMAHSCHVELMEQIFEVLSLQSHQTYQPVRKISAHFRTCNFHFYQVQGQRKLISIWIVLPFHTSLHELPRIKKKLLYRETPEEMHKCFSIDTAYKRNAIDYKKGHFSIHIQLYITVESFFYINEL